MLLSNKFLCSLLLFSSAIAPAMAYYDQRGPRNHPPQENVEIYNENFTPPGYGYYGYPPIPTPQEAFPDEAEAGRLFDNLHH